MQAKTATNVTVTDSYTTVLELKLGGGSSLVNFEVENMGGTNPTTGFKVQLQDNPGVAWYDYLSGTDFDSTDLSNMLFASAVGPHELPYGDIANVHIRVNAAYALRFRAVCGSGLSTTLAIRASLNRGSGL